MEGMSEQEDSALCGRMRQAPQKASKIVRLDGVAKLEALSAYSVSSR